MNLICHNADRNFLEKSFKKNNRNFLEKSFKKNNRNFFKVYLKYRVIFIYKFIDIFK